MGRGVSGVPLPGGLGGTDPVTTGCMAGGFGGDFLKGDSSFTATQRITISKRYLLMSQNNPVFSSYLEIPVPRQEVQCLKASSEDH